MKFLGKYMNNFCNFFKQTDLLRTNVLRESVCIPLKTVQGDRVGCQGDSGRYPDAWG